MAISRMQMNRQLRAGGGIMDITPRENFGLGSKFKKFVRKIIPNEIADVAVKAAPFVAPFNPLIAAGMAGLGGFDQSGSLSKSLRSGALTYGLGNLARVVGGAGFQGGLKAPGTGQGFGSYFTSPMSGQQLFGGPKPTPAVSTSEPLGIEEMLYETDPSKLTLGQQADIVAQQVSQTPTKTGYKDIFGKILGKDATLAERTEAIKKLGGKALKDIYTTDKGKVDKLAIAATVSGVGSYIEAKKLAEEAGLVDDADEYTEAMYEADKAKYADKYSQYLTPEAFGLKEGGRVNFLKGGDTSYNAMITEMYIKAGGEEGTGMDIDSFAEKYFPKMQDGGRVNLEAGGIPSITLPKKDYNFMDLIDEDAEEEYYKKREEELDRKYNPQNYTQVLPKEKPMDQYMLNEVMSERGMNTLSEEARDDAMKMYAERAYKKGQISEAEYNEIMGFKKGGRVGYKDGPSKSDIFGLGGEKGVEKIGKDIEEGLGSMASIITDKDGNVYLPLQYLRKFGEDIFFGGQKNSELPESFYNKLGDEYIEEMKKVKERGYEKGGRVQYAMGSEVPIRENQAGVNEMDFRETGGFVPPIGVKEKADDIPAMLSNNEFVFTADAVRAAGGGSVNKGAQRMYNMMKSLEGKVV